MADSVRVFGVLGPNLGVEVTDGAFTRLVVITISSLPHRAAYRDGYPPTQTGLDHAIASFTCRTRT